MKVNQQNIRTIWREQGCKDAVNIIDQRFLPHEFKTIELKSWKQAAKAISEMWVRGAPLIGVTGAYGLYLAGLENPSDVNLIQAAETLKATRPTAVNLEWAINLALSRLPSENELRANYLLTFADNLAETDVETCRLIGVHGLELIQNIYQRKKQKVQILTHCNAGWLGCVDYGTATSPIYQAYESGIPLHVWVDETRPRNQGANLTAWELSSHGIEHTVIVDNAGGHLMQHNKVDIVIVGSDRTTRTGDVANKIGTYLKALAAADNNIPFYVALPSSTFDFSMRNGISEIPIEERNPNEVHFVSGWDGNKIIDVRVTPKNSDAINYGFDVTPARLITGLITERGICIPNESNISQMFNDLIKN